MPVSRPFQQVRRRFPEPGFVKDLVVDRSSLVGLTAVWLLASMAYLVLFYYLDLRVAMTTGLTWNQVVYSILVGAMLSLVIVGRVYARETGLITNQRGQSGKSSVGVSIALAGASSMFVSCGGSVMPFFALALFAGAAAGSLQGFAQLAQVVIEASSLFLLWLPLHGLARLWFADLHGSGISAASG